MHGLGGGMGGGWLIWIILIGLAIWAIITLSNKNRRQSQGSPHRNNALEVLKERYAKGEISKKEFEEKKRDVQE